MNLKQSFMKVNTGLARILLGSPIIGKHYRAKLDTAVLERLRLIESRFSSPVVRFSSQLHDLYDCLKDLEDYLEIRAGDFHGYELTTYTKSSVIACALLEQLTNDHTVNPENYFKGGDASIHTDFLDWFSDEESLNDFVAGVSVLLFTYCSRVPKVPTPDGEPFVGLNVYFNDTTETFISGRYFKLLLLDLIQTLTVVLEQRVGG